MNQYVYKTLRHNTTANIIKAAGVIFYTTKAVCHQHIN